MKKLLFILLLGVLTFMSIAQAPKQLTNGAPAYIPNYLILQGNLYFYDGSDYINLWDTVLVQSDSTWLYYTQRQVDSAIVAGGGGVWINYGDSIEYEGKTITDTLTADKSIGIGVRHPNTAFHLRNGTLTLDYGKYDQVSSQLINSGVPVNTFYINDTLKLAEDVVSSTIVSTAYNNSILDSNSYSGTGNLKYYPNQNISKLNYEDVSAYYGRYNSTRNTNSNSSGLQSTDFNSGFNVITGDSIKINAFTGYNNAMTNQLLSGGILYIPTYKAAFFSGKVSLGPSSGAKVYIDDLYGLDISLTQDVDIENNITNAKGLRISGDVIADNLLGLSQELGKSYFENKITVTDTVETDVINIINEGLIRDTTFLDFVNEHGGSLPAGSDGDIIMADGAGGGKFNANFNYSSQRLLLANGNNIFIGGTASGEDITIGSSNVALGNFTAQQIREGVSNVMLGTAAGYVLYDGDKNVLIGSNSGRTLTNGTGNTFVGSETGYSNTSSSGVFIGFEAGRSNTSGANNTFTGYQAGYSNVSSAKNAYYGYQSGYSTTGADNTFLGYRSGYSSSVVGESVCIGSEAGYSNLTGDENTYIGYRSGYTNTGGRNVAIGNSCLELGSGGFDNVFMGNFAGYQSGGGSENVGIGRSSLQNTTASGVVAIGYRSGNSNTTGASNTFLGYQSGYTNSTSGSLTFVGYQSGYLNTGLKNTFMGFQAGYSNTTGTNNTFTGHKAGYGSTGSYNTFMGDDSGQGSNTGSYNTFLGYYTGAINTSGGFNTFVGANVGPNNGTGGNNTFVGYNAGNSNTTGGNNTYIGFRAGYSDASSTGNLFLGYQAGYNSTGNRNQFIGYEAGLANTTGYNNTITGHQAGDSNIDGALNVIYGYKASRSLTSGDGNTFIGYESGTSVVTGDYNVFLGFQAGANATGSNKLYIDNTNTATPLIYGDFSSNTATINGDLNVTGTLTGNGVMQVVKAQVLYTNTSQTTIITLPANAVIEDIKIEVITLFDGSGTDLLTVGITGETNRYITSTDVSATYFEQVLDYAIGTQNYITLNVTNFPNATLIERFSSSTNVTFQYTDQNSDATQGEAFVYIKYFTL